MRTRFILLTTLLCFFFGLTFAQERENSYSILFYNIENMFHPSDDSLTKDDDFTPEGVRRWTYYKYHKKTSSICKLILCANAWDSPDLIGLCELENEQVLKDIINHPLMIKTQYGFLHRESVDHRGMDVALLYREDRTRLLAEHYIQPTNEQGESLKTRDLLIGTFLIGPDTVVVGMNHWTSKYGGEMETEGKRVLQAELLGNYIDSIRLRHPAYHIVVGGDFNDVSMAKSITLLKDKFSAVELDPINFSGSYKYLGRWESLDHVFVGGNIEKSLVSTRIVVFPFLLEEDLKNGGDKPKRTFSGYRYNGGISDHLPLLFLYGEEERLAGFSH